MQDHFWLKAKDGVEIYVHKWYEPKVKPHAIVQISHGMVEHIKRYDDFSNHLLNKGIFVYGNDHRGHGETGERQGLFGFLADEDGFDKTAEDMYQLTLHIKKEYPGVPVILLGHSMGSFLARRYIQYHSHEIDALILSGTGFYPKLTTLFGKKLADTLQPKIESKVMNSIVFGNFNKRIPNKKTKFDWLSRDESVVQAYVHDPYAGYIPTGKFFVDLMTGLMLIHDQRQNKNIRNDLPTLIISGDEDPVGNYGKGIWKTANLLTNAGLTNITTSLFNEARHETLNEINKHEVYHFIYEWIRKHLP
ncbi:alpha/beta hydrolase [Ornithinibacillus halophilus]|uniref:Lysophospholipase, alpha-beta hydrolase superfamily n=1 Tax=Ornithinibacillus halophilus TaxID=930117 RepID=A0A1M5F354_9BACI|nr:alpha/beta hydrolase [Ornithinibacillus halophilus]SHF85926.1 Lysophospholipase, alpha-beta hydrolase superfamily [Ornithinibacillus halophilus]